jgi:hypothetical protein
MAKRQLPPTSTVTETPPPLPKGKPPGNKTVCPITREEFAAGAKPITVTIDGVPHVAMVQYQKDGTIGFSTGSLGWNINGKTQVKVGDEAVSCQIGFNLTVVGSKEVA